MSSKRGGPAPRPPKPDEYGIILATKEAVTGWDDLRRQAPGPTATLYDRLTAHPHKIDNPRRQGKLKGALGSRTVKGREYQQMQYEVTGGGRVWYVVDDERKEVLITFASTGHPKSTD